MGSSTTDLLGHSATGDTSFGTGDNYETSDDGKQLIFTYPDGSRLVIRASYFPENGEGITNCFDETEGPLEVFAIEGQPRDLELFLRLAPCDS